MYIKANVSFWTGDCRNWAPANILVILSINCSSPVLGQKLKNAPLIATAELSVVINRICSGSKLAIFICKAMINKTFLKDSSCSLPH